MQVAQAEVIYQGLFDRLMQNEEAIGIDPAGLKCEPFRHMPIDVDSLAIAAISGEIWNVVTPSSFTIWRTTASSARSMKLDTYHSGTRSFFGLACFAGIGFSFVGGS
jgi:hypothetical protein